VHLSSLQKPPRRWTASAWGKTTC